MKMKRTISIAAATLLIASLTAFAGDEKMETKKDAPKEMKNQTNCPVMGGKIDSTVFTDIQGQRVYHCCPMCSDKLKKDPDTYFKKAAAEGILYENIQTTCPMSGKKLENKSMFADFEGRRIAFCSEMCRTAFIKDPQKILNQMDIPTDQKKAESGHEGHNH